MRMFDAVRNAAICVHISARKYTTMDAAASATAAQPYAAMLMAACQFGATSIRSRATNQMHRNGPKLSSCDMPDSAQPRYVSALRLPAKSRICASPLRSLGCLTVAGCFALREPSARGSAGVSWLAPPVSGSAGAAGTASFSRLESIKTSF